jgi:predicted RNA-binding protein with RPS1 domain
MKNRKLDKNRSDQKSKKGKDKDKEGFKKLLNNMTKISLRTKQSIVSALDRQINWI